MSLEGGTCSARRSGGTIRASGLDWTDIIIDMNGDFWWLEPDRKTQVTIEHVMRVYYTARRVWRYFTWWIPWMSMTFTTSRVRALPSCHVIEGSGGGADAGSFTPRCWVTRGRGSAQALAP